MAARECGQNRFNATKFPGAETLVTLYILVNGNQEHMYRWIDQHLNRQMLKTIEDAITKKVWPLRDFSADCSKEDAKMFCSNIAGKHGLMSLRL